MNAQKLNNKIINGVHFLSEKTNEFESSYIKLRKSERRIYTDEEVGQLPVIREDHKHYKEWYLRRKSLTRFNKYLHNTIGKHNLLDIGCGNGWFSYNIACKTNLNVYAIDINITELEQAARVFKKDNLNFYYANIFEDIFEKESFKLISLNSSVQYFDNFEKLINRLLYFLRSDGEIHIIDSPLYFKSELTGAKERTARYFSSIGFPEMIKFYHHHTFDELNKFNYSLLYNPRSTLNKLKRLSGLKDSPFPWIKITR